MISANNVTFRVGKKALFEDVNIKFTEGNCYGLIGANGAGKSTFLKILSGQLDTTNGDIAITPGQRLSVLEQDHFKYDAYPVMDTVILGNERLYQIMKEKDAIYAKEDFTDEDGIRASELEAEFAEMDGWEAESNAAMLLNGLGIDTDLHYAMMSDLTGNDKVKGPGHDSQIITDDKGQDWMYYHGYDMSSIKAGRKMFLEQVRWVDGWPVLGEDGHPSVTAPAPFVK